MDPMQGGISAMHRALPTPGILFSLLVGTMLATGISGCSDNETAGGSAPTPEVQNVGMTSQGGPTASRTSQPDRYVQDASNAPLVRIATSLGPIELRLDPQAAPITVQNFLNYVQSGYYAETVFHYVEQGRLILGGGLTPEGSPRPTSMAIRNEAHNGRKNKRGTIAMARDAAVIDSATSQFFINLQDAPHLDHAGEAPDNYGYCVFGEVTKGLDVAEKISAIPMETRTVDGEQVEVPARTVRIESMEVLR
jgi:cyclophilin family peptidyl-prolyl cis-trans isomerase